MNIGEKIRRRRKELGMTQEELAKTLGKTKSAICKVETGKDSNLTLDRIEVFAEALRTTTDYLVTSEDQKILIEVKRTNENCEIFEKRNYEYIKKYNELIQKDKDTINVMIDALYDKK